MSEFRCYLCHNALLGSWLCICMLIRHHLPSRLRHSYKDFEPCRRLVKIQHKLDEGPKWIRLRIGASEISPKAKIQKCVITSGNALEKFFSFPWPKFVAWSGTFTVGFVKIRSSWNVMICNAHALIILHLFFFSKVTTIYFFGSLSFGLCFDSRQILGDSSKTYFIRFSGKAALDL